MPILKINDLYVFLYLVCSDDSAYECLENDFETCSSDLEHREACKKSCGLCRGNMLFEFEIEMLLGEIKYYIYIYIYTS